MKRWPKLLLVFAAITTAFCLTFVWPRHNSLGFDIDTSPRARAAKKRAPYDLSRVRALKVVVTKINNNYVEPDRIDYRRMLLSGLNAIQRAVAPVLIHHDPGKPTFRVQVGEASKEFSLEDVNGPWLLTWRFEKIFKFLQDQFEADEDIDLREVEYAAINGMLRTLDPHSVLLTPEEFSEMQLNTRGEFGGLGIVIAIRDGALTVIRPMPGTPAARAGLVRRDRIVKINEESTLNMPLEEAVSRLRGKPGSSVNVWINRDGAKGWKKPRRFELVRDIIHIDSVESRMLKDKIGHVSIKNFQSNTCDDLRAALSKLRRQGMRGLVLDFRDNPGGLLTQAECVGDTFLSSGTIVTTSSNDPSKRSSKPASAEGTEPFYPMVVLSNGGSASASEIVAGALKNHDRAIVVGQRTFGKGSVQVLYSDDADGWALKLTIAQYLTPGDISIQGVGIVPDIEIAPMTVDSDDMDLTPEQGYTREADLAAHLTHDRTRGAQKPSVVLRYYLPAKTRQRLREAMPEDLEENEQEDEFLTRFSAELLAAAVRPGRRELLRDATPVIQGAQEREMKLAEAELRQLGIDWTVGPDAGPSKVTARARLSTETAKAGEPLELTVALTNEGDKPLYQLRGVTKSDNRLFAERELVFGRLEPGETRSWTTTLGVCRKGAKRKGRGGAAGAKDAATGERTCTLPKGLTDRADGIRIEFSEAHGHPVEPAEARTVVQSRPRPRFAYTVHVADDRRGNGDGYVQPGELATVYLTVRNVGEGLAEEPEANLRNLGGEGILLHAGRFQLDEMAPGAEKTVAFTFEVLPEFTGTEAKLQVSVADSLAREGAGEKLLVPVGTKAVKLGQRSERVLLSEGAVIRESPAQEARAVARVEAGPLQLPAEATRGKYVRVKFGGGRPGWVLSSQLGAVPAKAEGRLVDVLAHMPPRVDVDVGSTLVTREPHLQVKGKVTDDDRLRDLYIYVNARKVHYQAVPKSKLARELAFDTTVPLTPGINFVTVVARESNDVVSTRTLVVRNDAPDGSLQKTPRNDEELYFHPFGE